jgi:hypothetical protein
MTSNSFGSSVTSLSSSVVVCDISINVCKMQLSTYQCCKPQSTFHDLSSLLERHCADRQLLGVFSPNSRIADLSSIHRDNDSPIIITITLLRLFVEQHSYFKFLLISPTSSSQKLCSPHSLLILDIHMSVGALSPSHHFVLSRATLTMSAY